MNGEMLSMSLSSPIPIVLCVCSLVSPHVAWPAKRRSVEVGVEDARGGKRGRGEGQ